MRVPIEMQRLSPDMESAVIISWLAAVGDEIEVGAPIVELETDKVDVEMEAMDSGVLVEIVHDAGAEVAVGDPIGFLEVAG